MNTMCYYLISTNRHPFLLVSINFFCFNFYWSTVDLPEKAMAPHSGVLAWRNPGIGEPGGLLSMGSHRVGHD